MFVKTNAKSISGDNLGSCRKYAEYLSKYNTHFFNHSSNSIELEEAILLIDVHSKGQLKKDEAKWYAPIYSLSQNESQYIVYKLFGKICNDYDELSDDEKKIFNEYVVDLGKKFQDQMAINFNKSNLGINDGNDLCYIGVVENERNYKSFDEEVKLGKKSIGDKKIGFNTHIHIIQSRKANNKKKSKISPESNSRKSMKNNLGAIVGFDRNNFYNLIEKTFDLVTDYKRDIKEKFEYKKKNKFKKIYGDSINFKPKQIDKNQIKNILTTLNLSNYFFYLTDLGKINFEKSEKDKLFFSTKNKRQTIEVSKTNWKFSNSKKQNTVFKASELFEKSTWLETMNNIKNTNGFKNYSRYYIKYNTEERNIIQDLKLKINSSLKRIN